MKQGSIMQKHGEENEIKLSVINYLVNKVVIREM